MTSHHFFANRGFSLVEVLVAITILLLVMVGPMRILSQATNSTTYSSEQIIAYFLAQEGLEQVQLVRDNFLLQSFSTTTAPITNPMSRTQTNLSACFAASGCGLYSTNVGTTTQFVSCSVANNCQLYLNAAVNVRARYTHSAPGNAATPYTRIIKMSAINNPDTGRVESFVATSTVTWRSGSLIAGQQVELVTYLTNIYDTP